MSFKRNITLSLYDAFKGTKINYYYNKYLKILNYSEDVLNTYKERKLFELIRYAYENVPYYKKLLDELSLKPNEVLLNDNFSMMPCLSREIIQEKSQSLISQLFENRKRLFKGSSSGTTGEPINYYHDVDGESAGNASGYLQWHLSGWHFGMKGIHIWGNLDSIKHWSLFTSKAKRFIFNTINIPSTLFNDFNNYKDIITIIQNSKPDYIDGYTNSIYQLALFLKNEKTRLDNIKFVFTTAENLQDYQREIIENYLGPVIDNYGCGEINGVATQIKGNKKYFIIEPRVIVEKGKKFGDYYEIVITDLDNKVMPLIKYKPGDLIDGLYFDKSEQLPYSYFNKIIGRTNQIIELRNGKKILPVNLIGGTFIRSFKSITKHKVIWDGNKLDFIFESAQEISKDRISEKLDEILKGYDIRYSFKIVDKILPNRNGKYSYFENKVNK